jgi:hypothetical protein
MSANVSSTRDTAPERRLPLPCLALVFTLCILLSNVPSQAATNIYSTGFQASEGYNTNLDLVGQNGWRKLGSGGNGLLTDVFPGQGQQAYVGFSAPESGDDYLFVYQPINKAFPQAQFSVTMSVFDSSATNSNWDDFEWGVYNQEGDFLFSLDFDNYELAIYYYLDNNNPRVSSGLTYTNGIAYPVRIDLDFANNRWSATFNGKLVATNQPITTKGSPLNLGDIDASWIVFNADTPGDNYMVFDNYLITASVPSPRLSPLGFLGKSPVLRLTGTPNMAFAIEASTNLTGWLPLKTNVTTGGYFDYVDDGAASLPRRFYRARWAP